MKRPPASDPFARSLDQEPDGETAHTAFPRFFRAPDESDAGYLNRAELLSFLNRLLEGKRAGARGVGAMANTGRERREPRDSARDREG